MAREQREAAAANSAGAEADDDDDNSLPFLARMSKWQCEPLHSHDNPLELQLASEDIIVRPISQVDT
jgi:hypothetical protein